MIYKEYNKIVKMMIKEEEHVGKTKGLEYSTDQDKLEMFNTLSLLLGVSKDMICTIFIMKHIFSILSYIKNGKTLSEPIEERIKDIRVYLSLFRAIIEEKKSQTGRGKDGNRIKKPKTVERRKKIRY